MAQHDDRPGAYDLGRIFEAADDIRVDDVAGYARAEHVSNSLIENQFWSHARIDAADNGSVGRLVTRGLLDLRH